MNTLSDFSIDELKRELEEREKKLTKPIPLCQRGYLEDWSAVRNNCKEYINVIAEGAHDEDDLEHYIFEAALEAVFGKEVWKWVNENI